MKIREFRRFFGRCMAVAVAIFLLAILSEVSVRTYFSTNNVFAQIISSLIIVLAMTFVLMFAFYFIPELKKF